MDQYGDPHVHHYGAVGNEAYLFGTRILHAIGFHKYLFYNVFLSVYYVLLEVMVYGWKETCLRKARVW
eukprot:CAMPEP_0116828192 /NCGR_PEP_ID=MMETSP0418-20121206/3522_1 /TAXON_ID=1158023 /ORGANISM="Astrosyne radiata, Strain 13vi08-1A" /LENGTH=67 /DNA_ID=CAMNT_0004457059 /DNA_START=191 /DNA_END=391 /DNA_ORIENTATION=+